jgi:DNA-binding response OmpR family regulator
MSFDSRKLRLLVVEECTITVEQVREVLKALPFDVRMSVAETEAAAVSLAGTTQPHVVILDLHLSEGSGFGVLRALNAMERKPITVILTNFAIPSYRELAVLIGADYFLDKARDMEALPDLMDAITQRLQDQSSDRSASANDASGRQASDRSVSA